MSTTAVREKPILFSAPMVWAILEGRKTQTRRVVDLRRLSFTPSWVGWVDHPDDGPGWYAQDVDASMGEVPEFWDECRLFCPYGVPEDLLWVRETWAEGVKGFVYRADYDVSDGFGSHVIDMATGDTVPLAWRPSIHMRREASRLTLRVTGVRVERLQDITEDDAKAEGADLKIRHDDDHWSGWGLGDSVPEPIPPRYNRRDWFRYVWEIINDKRPGCSWESNPWVWVVAFERID